jgi:hypothetical protein
VKTYKLWVEIEEHDTLSGEYRSLTDDGSVSPVPIAQFSDLESAVQFAESLAIDAPVRDIAPSSFWN